MIRRVVGDSMYPTLIPGRVVFGLKSISPKIGSLVIVKHNGREIIKRLVDTSGNKLYILGDNSSSSTDSRNFGWITKKDLLATVILPTKK